MYEVLGGFKIGIANNVQERRNEIQRKLERPLLIIASGLIYNARRFENKLHRQYQDYNYKHPSRCSGYTEFFKLSPIQAIGVYLMIKNKSDEAAAPTLLFGIFICVVLCFGRC